MKVVGSDSYKFIGELFSSDFRSPVHSVNQGQRRSLADYPFRSRPVPAKTKATASKSPAMHPLTRPQREWASQMAWQEGLAHPRERLGMREAQEAARWVRK